MVRRVFLATALVTASTGLGVAVPANAAPKPQNCVITVGDVDRFGNFEIEDMTCYDTYAQVLTSRGAVGVSASITPKGVESSMLLSLGIIGTHYDGAGATGASLSIQGSDCNGGGLNVPSSWNDRISSTTNGCGAIIHYENINYTGATTTTWTVGATTNISGYMDNRTTSIKYFS